MRQVPSLILCAAVAAVPAAAQRPAVFLNHVVVVVDSATYQAIGTSPFFRDSLGSVERRSTTADGGASWSGTYLYGQHTYLELFAPGGPAGDASGSMIGFGVDRPGDLWVVRDRLVESGLVVDSILRSRARGGEQIPWFHAIAVRDAMTASRMPTWVMEYHADYQRRWTPDAPTSRLGIRRDQILADRYDASRPLVDVIAVEVALDGADRTRVERELAGYGYRAEGNATYRGPGIRIGLHQPVSRRGVVAVELALRGKRLGPGVRRIGASADLEVTDRGTVILTVR